MCGLLMCLYAWEWIDTYHRSRSCFWQELEESVINRHVLKVEWFQLGHGGDGLSTQPGCLRVECKPVQSQFLDLWKNVCWTINSRDAWKLRKKTSTFFTWLYLVIFLIWSLTCHWLHVYLSPPWWVRTFNIFSEISIGHLEGNAIS